MDELARWYVIHTYSGYEVMVKTNLEKIIENNNLGDQILEIRIPMYQDIVEGKNGKKKVVDRKVFPCYVFLKLIYSNDIWYLITNTRGVTGFVGPQGRPLALTDEEIKRMRLETKVDAVDFAVGDSIKVVTGALEGFVGVVTELNYTTQKLKAKVEMFGRETEVDLEFIDVEKITLL